MRESQTKSQPAATFIPGTVAEAYPQPLVHSVDSASGLALDSLGRRMRRAALWLTVMLVGSYTFLDYWAYSFDFHAHPAAYDLFLHGQGSAPAQYRIGLIFAAKVLHNVVHLGYRHSFALFDFILGLAAVWLLRGVLVASRSFRAATPAMRWMRLALFFGLLSFYFSWSLWYQRPETLACAFFVAASLYLLTVARSQALLIGGFLILSACQGFIRADVAILFHFGLFIYVLLRGSKDFFASRGVLLATSFACCVLPTVILWLLMHKVFPQATYGDTKVFQLLMNLSPGQLVPFLLFLAPTLYTYKRALARFAWLEGPEAALLLIGALYLCSWALVGRLQEVRIFVPFAMALMPLGANLVADELTDRVGEPVVAATA